MCHQTSRRAETLGPAPSTFALLVCALLLVLPAVASAAPLAVSGALRTTTGGPVADGTYLVLLRLYDVQNGGVPLFEEAVDVDVVGGFFHHRVGADPAKPLADAVFIGSAPRFLGVKVGAEPELPRVAMDPAPRAVHAQTAASLACTGCVGSVELAPGAVGAQHVDFTYAGSASKGGPATVAVTAQTAEFATVADEAMGLSCVGCVGLTALDDTVAGGFVPTTGGAVQGDLSVSGTLGLGGATVAGGVLSGTRLASVDTAIAPCAAANSGEVGVDAAHGALAFCAGAAGWRLLPGCDPSCPAAGEVSCGAPIESGCGALVSCQGSGTKCPDGLPCTASGVCGGPGQFPSTAGTTCKALLGAGVVDDGVYWIDPDGDGGTEPFEVWCDMTTGGGGWTRCGRYDEVVAGASELIVHEGDTWVSNDAISNKSFCAKLFETVAPAALLIHNQTSGADHGEGEKLVVTWGADPMTLWQYDNHPMASCEALIAGKSWNDCRYATHSGWGATTWSFTVGGLNSGYSGNASKRLVLGVTAKAGSNSGASWHNFGAETNPENVGNSWAQAANVGDLYLR